MRTRLAWAVTASLLLLVPTGFSPGEEMTPTLTIERVKIHPKGKVKLVARFASEILPVGYRADEGVLKLGAGSATLLSLPPVDDRAIRKQKQGWTAVYRERRSRARAGIRRARIDLAAGKLVFRAKKLEIPGLFAASPKDVPFALTIGESVFTETVDLARKGKCLVYRRPKSETQFVPNPPGGGGPGPVEEEPPAFRVLHDLCYYPELLDTGYRVIRDQAIWEQTWRDLAVPWPSAGFPEGEAPAVDFSTETVVAILAGVRAAKLEITAVETQGVGAIVRYTETQFGNCPTPGGYCPRALIVAIDRVAGLVTFDPTIVVWNCQ